MKNKLLLLLSTPNGDFETHLFIARLERYFKQSKKNSPLLLFASLVLFSHQLYLESPLWPLIAWQCLLVLFTAIIYCIDHQQQSSAIIECHYKILRKRLFYRLVYGLIVAALFGASTFLIPTDAPFDHLAIYYIFLICLFAIILISNVIFPEYYFGYGFVVITLVYLHTLSQTGSHSEGFIIIASLIYPIGAVFMTIKATEMSKRAINEVALGLILKKQMAEMLELQQVIKYQSEHDQLTGLANRRKFENCAYDVENNAKSKQLAFGIVYIDLDQFKPINDQYGHAYGDKVLQEIAERLNKCSRDTDLVCRMGGDEFCILIKDVDGTQHLEQLSIAIEQRLQQSFIVEDVNFNLSASIGTAIYPEDGLTVDELVSHADHNMYRHKQQKLTVVPSG